MKYCYKLNQSDDVIRDDSCGLRGIMFVHETSDLNLLWRQLSIKDTPVKTGYLIQGFFLSCFISPEQLIALISAAKQHDVKFVYAISPGLDITFSNPREVAALKRKLDQVGRCMQSEGCSQGDNLILAPCKLYGLLTVCFRLHMKKRCSKNKHLIKSK